MDSSLPHLYQSRIENFLFQVQKQAASQIWPPSYSLPTSVLDLAMMDTVLASWHLLLMGEMDIEEII